MEMTSRNGIILRILGLGKLIKTTVYSEICVFIYILHIIYIYILLHYIIYIYIYLHFLFTKIFDSF